MEVPLCQPTNTLSKTEKPCGMLPLIILTGKANTNIPAKEVLRPSGKPRNMNALFWTRKIPPVIFFFPTLQKTI